MEHLSDNRIIAESTVVAADSDVIEDSSNPRMIRPAFETAERLTEG